MIGVYFEPIIAPPFNDGVIRLYILNEGRKILTEIKKDFQRSVDTWQSKPKFEKEIGFSTTELKLHVYTVDENYVRVSEGTKAKPRVARGVGPGLLTKGAKALKLVPYDPKTTPGELDAKEGGVAGGPIIFRRYALESGEIKARKFDDLVFEIWDEAMPERIQEAMDAAAIKTGYAF